MLTNLNPEQRIGVETTEGPVLILSGAGTGKTRVLTTRIAHILSSGLANPWEVLALTFTNKAANEMKDRLQQMIGGMAGAVWMGTFHAIGVKILRANAERAGLKNPFLILGEDDQKAVLKNIMQNMSIDLKKWPPIDAVEQISRLKDRAIRYDQAETHTGSTSSSANGFADGRLSEIYTLYQIELSRLNGVDYGDLILKPLDLLLHEPDILRKYQQQFKYILVDEYQDTNMAQYMLLRLLASHHRNICCVGDDDQSIYSWRGAEIQNILGFDREYTGTKIIRLETNYRSTPAILGVASSLIKHNKGRLGKDLKTNSNDSHDLVQIVQLYSDHMESNMIADEIESGHMSGQPYHEFAILIRNASLSRLFEEELMMRKIPYKLIGGTRFYDRTEIKDSVAYARLLVYPYDDVSMARILNTPKRGLGDVALAHIRDYAKSRNLSLFDAMRDMIETNAMPKRMKESCQSFVKLFESIRELIGKKEPAEVFQTLLDQSGYIKMWQESKDLDAKERLEHLRELIGLINDQHTSLEGFLEQVALMTMNDEESNTDHVSIMTLHAAKGLEFDTVFLPAWEEGIFPSERTLKEEGEKGLEEERRLAYVGITRARKKLIISTTSSRLVFGQRQNNLPSIFLDEIDDQFIEKTGFYNQKPKTFTPKPAVYKPKQKISNSVVGSLVEHDDLGRGVVIEQDGDFLTIAFQRTGIKKVSAEFIRKIT